MLSNATVFLPSEAALEALGQEGRQALLQDKCLSHRDDDGDEDVDGDGYEDVVGDEDEDITLR